MLPCNIAVSVETDVLAAALLVLLLYKSIISQLAATVDVYEESPYHCWALLSTSYEDERASAMQVDNPSPNAAYPITAASPHVQSRFFRVATAVAANAVPKPAALCLRWSVWRSRPGHVVCVERLEMQTAPLLLELEQAHAMQLMSFGNSMVAPFTDESERVKYALTCYFGNINVLFAICSCWLKIWTTMCTQIVS